MEEAHRYGIASRKVHLNPTSELTLLARAPALPGLGGVWA